LNNSLISLKRIEIGKGCFTEVDRFVIDGLNELESLIIEEGSFTLDDENSRGSSCLIMNCDQLKQIHIGYWSFRWYESFELKNLPSLTSIHLDQYAWLKIVNEKTRKGSKCLIMNCDQLKDIHIGRGSFYWYESFELKNLPSLISIQLDRHAFMKCHRIVFESMNDWMNDEWDLNQLQSITLSEGALQGETNTIESNVLIMKSMNNNDTDDQIFLL